jgi:uncharacterized protein YaeQ
VRLTVSDITRSYYQSHDLTIARHPSETDQRMAVQILAFALNANEHLRFAKGMSDPDEPDLWEIDLTGQIQHWIMLGQAEEKRIRQACSKARRVSVYTYQKGAAVPWFDDIKANIQRFKHLRVVHLAMPDESTLAKLISRSMEFDCTIQDDQMHLSDAQHSITIDMQVVKEVES